ncbi:UDP-glucose 6-dehydrogenase 3-like [Rosa rugosa]|uniref:UDP-glucose 6-dehydrogenase 3-like n=1 Tax=Rosa rugosa TaxID=74645 RepID=UPI002B417876|nr:UDP-glucose 6-dehydrogenase 3-like [Rosa rugosa]
MANQNAVPMHFNEITHICCIGARHASIMSMAVIAEAHPNITVTIVDFDLNVLEPWVARDVDLVEPGFEQLLDEVLDVNMFFSDQVQESINEAQMIFIGVEIPIKRRGIGARSRLDLTQWELAIRSIMAASVASKVIVEKTTMPIDVFNHTTRLLGQRPQNQQNLVQFAVFSNPDLYTPGRAIEDLRNPDQVVIARKSNVGNVNVLVQLYAEIVENPDRIIVLSDHVSAELAKIGTSVAIGAKITLMSMIATVCDKTGANFNSVRQVIGGDYRLNNNYMDATLGIGGPDLMKDILYFKGTLRENGLATQASLVNQIVKLSKKRIKEFVELVLTNMVSLNNKVIAVFGVTYKSNIADLTNSPAIAVCKSLLKEGAILRIFDPLVTEGAIMGCFRNTNRVEVAANQQAAYNQAHATLCLVATDLQFDFAGMSAAMTIPPYLFIACNLDNIDVVDIRALGFQLYIFGNQFPLN